MKYRFFLAVAALMALAACSSDNDIIEPQQPTTDDGVVKTPISITAIYGDGSGNAGTTRVAYTESGANISATWESGDEILVAVDNQVSTLTLTDGAGSSSATFTGTISHTNPLTATTPLVCYVKDQKNPSAVTVNADGSYTYTSGTFTSQDGTLAGAASCNLYYGMTHYGNGTDISCNFSVNTSMMKFNVDAPGLTEGSATLSYKSGDDVIASATFTIAADGRNTVYMAIPAGHLTGAQTLRYESTANTVTATATLSDAQANFAAGQTYSKSIMVLTPSTEDVTLTDGVTLCGTGGGNTKVTIAAGATVTFGGVDINEQIEYMSYRGIDCKGDATIKLKGKNTVKVKDFPNAAIFIPEGHTLTIEGTGSLYADGYGAGIGGDEERNCGNIVINSGTITAIGLNAAGIGSKYNKSCGNITITGGTVTATGGDYGAAGIGTGEDGSCGNIIITGGTVTATGGDNAAGIGSGYTSSFNSITIGNGITRVTATRGSTWNSSTDAQPIGAGAGDTNGGPVTFGGVNVTGETIKDGDTFGGLTIAVTTNGERDVWTLTPVTP